MLDPMLHHLYQAKLSAQFFAQMIQLDPDLGLPAALPLLAARLMGTEANDDDVDDGLDSPDLAVM